MARTAAKELPTGFRRRHARRCASRDGRRCSCQASYEARVYSARDERVLSKVFPTLAAAKAWRADTASKVSRGVLRAPTSTTTRQAAAALLEGMDSGAVRSRSGDPYKPSVIRSYRSALDVHILPVIGALSLSAVERHHIQAIADSMLASGAQPSTIRNALMPLRVIYRRALDDGVVAVSPCERLRLPAVRGRRERIASSDEAAALLAALPSDVRVVYALAFYAGLRLGELRALRWQALDFTRGLIDIRHALDAKAVRIAPKSAAGVRFVPIVSPLRAVLLEHRLATGARGYVVSGRTPDRPFTGTNMATKARKAWQAAKLRPILLHECRHTFASILIAAGVNAKAISVAMGHSSIQITFDLYGKLMPGSEAELVQRVDAYLARDLGAELGARSYRRSGVVAPESGTCPASRALR